MVRDEDDLIAAMRAAGYEYDKIESSESSIRFYGRPEYMMTFPLTFSSWTEVQNWLESIIF